MNQILKWYKGKALENAKAALELLQASETQGAWVKGASRRVWAALTKANVVQKHSRVFQGDHSHHFFQLYMAMQYGGKYVTKLTPADVAKLRAQDRDVESINAGLAFIEDMLPVVNLMIRLDNTRPKPVFTNLGVSPTLTATLETFKAVSVEPCPCHYEEGERVDPVTGKKSYYFFMILDWPEGTVHGLSRYQGTDNNSQCEACGHAIKNPFNWVPLILTTADGKPKSLWVGRDCSLRLFNIKVEGEIEISKDGANHE